MTERQSVKGVKAVKERPRTKKREERIAEITAAAKAVFFEKGYFSSTIDEIARRAGISKGTVYLYFKNKDELYVALMLPNVDEFTDLLLSLEKDVSSRKYSSGAGIIMKFCDIFTAIYQHDPDGLRVFQVYHLLELSSIMEGSVRDKHRLAAERNGSIAVKYLFGRDGSRSTGEGQSNTGSQYAMGRVSGHSAGTGQLSEGHAERLCTRDVEVLFFSVFKGSG